MQKENVVFESIFMNFVFEPTSSNFYEAWDFFSMNLSMKNSYLILVKFFGRKHLSRMSTLERGGRKCAPSCEKKLNISVPETGGGYVKSFEKVCTPSKLLILGKVRLVPKNFPI